MSACYCEVDNPATIYHAERPMARRHRHCTECGKDIHPGERYENVAGLWEGEWSHYSTCHRCLALRDWLEATSCCFCWAHHNLLEDMQTEIQDGHWKPGFKFTAYRLLVDIRRAHRTIIP